MKKHIKWGISLLAVYLLLVKLLELSERSSGSEIKGYGEALWYSLITMSTVGYGDLVPVTPAGKMIGTVFILCSVGVLTAIIGFSLRMISGTMVPRMRLRFGKHRSWYVFSEENAESTVLASSLKREDPDCLLILPSDSDKTENDSSAVRLPFDTDTLIRLRGEASGISLFYMGSDPWDNYTRALSTAARGIKTYSMSDFRLSSLPAGLQLFSTLEAMSRYYWNNYPMKSTEKNIILIGCGKAGCALLERALLNNVFATERRIEYHVFGETQLFSNLHPEIIRALDRSMPDSDRLYLHSEAWESARALLRDADRIILCLDEDSDNLTAYEKLKSWYTVPSCLHIRHSTPLPGLDCFGLREEILTPEYVIKEELDHRAILMNDIYNEGSPNPTAWRDLSPFLRQSNIAAADHLLVKARYLLNDDTLTTLGREECAQAYARYQELYPTQADLLQEMEHRRWMRFYQMYNWQYSPVRNNDLRYHPLLIPYSQLSPQDQIKDSYAWEMFGRLAGC